MLSTVAEIIRDLLIFVGVIAALLIALVVVVSKLPDTNPLKRLLTALCYRLGATLAAGAIAIPLEPIPGIDLAYDIAVPIALIWYWFTFFRDARRAYVRHTKPESRYLSPIRVSDAEVLATRTTRASPALQLWSVESVEDCSVPASAVAGGPAAAIALSLASILASIVPISSKHGPA